MNLALKLPQVQWPQLGKATPKGRTAFVQWDRQTVMYLVVSKEREELRVWTQDKLARDPDLLPLQQVADLLKQDRISIAQFVVLLSRAELEMVNVTLPPAQNSEIPDLVRAQVEEQIGDGEQIPEVDYLLSEFREDTGGQALAFAIDSTSLDSLRKQAKQAGAKLAAVIPRNLASWGLLQQAPSLARPLAIAITLFDAEIELMILHRGHPNAVRTIRTRPDDMSVLAEQVATEIQRCLAVAENAGEEEALHLFVFGDRDVFAQLVDTLVEQFDCPVSLINPLDLMRSEGTPDRSTCHWYAALTGAASAYFAQQLVVNLVESKQAPKPPSPVRRWALLGGVAAIALIAVIYVLAGDLQELREEVATKQKQFESKANMARKRQEKADELRVAESWLQDEVNWLEELRGISEVLPGGQDVTVRRLTASATPAGSVVDLSVQVSQPDKVADLENRLRAIANSVASKRVSEQSSDEDYPWQFETRVALPRRTRPQPETEAGGAEEPAEQQPPAVETLTGAAAEEAADSNPATETRPEGDPS